MVALAIVALILLALTLDFFVEEYALRGRLARKPIDWLSQPVPVGLLLDPAHVWLKREKDHSVRLGSDGLVVAMLGKPDTVEVVARPGHIARGDALAELSRHGRSLTLRSPVAGTLLESNLDLDAESVAADPYGQGWLALVHPREELAEPGRVRGVQAQTWLQREWTRLRELVAGLAGDAAPVGASMADGGSLQPGFWPDLPEAACALVEQAFFVTPSSSEADDAATETGVRR